MIRVFVGSHKKFERCEPVIKRSILKHASEPVEINIMRPEYYGCEDSGCTGFSKMRWEVPRICNYEGHAIYLDVDMILMADIKELWSYKAYRSATIADGSTEVMVLNCENLESVGIIPKQWNCEDYSYPVWKIEDAKLIHFTDLKCQPWIHEHPHPELAKVWFDMEREALEAN